MWSRKKSFSTFAFSVSSVKISPSFSSVSIEEFEEGDINDFKIGHQSLDERFSNFIFRQMIEILVFIRLLYL